MTEEQRLNSQLVDLRRAFDDSFTRPASGVDAADSESYLALRVAGEAVAVRLDQVKGLAAASQITPVPSRFGDVLGLAGIRGRCVPVFSAAALMGYPGAGRRPEWFVLCVREGFPARPAPREGDLIALGFDAFEGYLDIPTDKARPGRPPDSRLAHVRGVIPAPAGARVVVDLASIAREIERRSNGDKEAGNG